MLGFAVTLSVSLYSLRAAAQAACYFPNGNPSDTDRPCLASGDSTCCGEDYVCLSNNLCVASWDATIFARGSCTDKSYNSSACPQFCPNDSTWMYGITMGLCAGSTTNYYCSSTTWDCSSGENIVSISPGSAISTMPHTLASSTTSSSSSTSSTSIPVTVSTSTVVVGAGSSTGTSSGGAAATQSPTAQNQDSDSNNKTGLSEGAKIGLGVAIPLAVIIVALLGYIVWSQRRTRNNNKLMADAAPGGGPTQQTQQSYMYAGPGQQRPYSPGFNGQPSQYGYQPAHEMPAEYAASYNANNQYKSPTMTSTTASNSGRPFSTATTEYVHPYELPSPRQQ